MAVPPEGPYHMQPGGASVAELLELGEDTVAVGAPPPLRAANARVGHHASVALWLGSMCQARLQALMSGLTTSFCLSTRVRRRRGRRGAWGRYHPDVLAQFTGDSEQTDRDCAQVLRAMMVYRGQVKGRVGVACQVVSDLSQGSSDAGQER
eukprot:547976-Pyramimonas_sp.AAC.2